MRWTQHRSRLANLSRQLPPDDPAVVEERREMRAAYLDEYVQAYVAEAPQLTSEQRDRIAVALRSGRGAAT